MSLASTYVFICIIITAYRAALTHAGECRISIINDMDIVNSPMVVTQDEESDRPNLVYPSPDDPANLHFDEGEEISVFCPGKDFRGIRVKESGQLLHIAGGEREARYSNDVDEDVETVRCVRGNKIEFDGRVVDFKTLSCDLGDKSSHGPIMKATDEKCSRGRKYVIGFEMPASGQFLETIHLCHDEQVAETLWSHNVVLPTNAHDYRQRNPKRPNFRAGSLYRNISMSSAKCPYKITNQIETLNRILGKNRGEKYVSAELRETKYLARGHLTANADEIYKTEQEATFFYANAVPMWQRINENPGNWYLVEDYVRHMAFVKKRPLDAWAGGFGILELENKLIFLAPNKQIPVPRLLFKCVVDRAAKESICFVVVNNPYLSKKEYEAQSDKYDRCERLQACDRIFPNHGDFQRGLMYCCGLNDFYRRNRQLLGLAEIEKFLNYKVMKLPPIARAKKSGTRRTSKRTV